MMTTTEHIGLGMAPNAVGIYDLYLKPDGNLAMAHQAEAVGQHARQRLMTYHGEWFLDMDIGMTWLDDIMAHKYNPALAEALIKTEIYDTDGITAIVSFSVKFDLPMRRLNVGDVQATTIYEDEVVTI